MKKVLNVEDKKDEEQQQLSMLTCMTDKSEQTVWNQIRLLLEEQSDQGLHCLPFRQQVYSTSVDREGGCSVRVATVREEHKEIYFFLVRDVTYPAEGEKVYFRKDNPKDV